METLKIWFRCNCVCIDDESIVEFDAMPPKKTAGIYKGREYKWVSKEYFDARCAFAKAREEAGDCKKWAWKQAFDAYPDVLLDPSPEGQVSYDSDSKPFDDTRL